jgi:hypothetical protein
MSKFLKRLIIKKKELHCILVRKFTITAPNVKECFYSVSLELKRGKSKKLLYSAENDTLGPQKKEM